MGESPIRDVTELFALLYYVIFFRFVTSLLVEDLRKLSLFPNSFTTVYGKVAQGRRFQLVGYALLWL